jgi:hypothetical protein
LLVLFFGFLCWQVKHLWIKLPLITRRSSTKFNLFMPIRNPRWPRGGGGLSPQRVCFYWCLHLFSMSKWLKNSF